MERDLQHTIAWLRGFEGRGEGLEAALALGESLTAHFTNKRLSYSTHSFFTSSHFYGRYITH